MILVDWDNIEHGTRRLGLETIVEKIFFLISEHLDLDKIGKTVRIYGGWYDRDILSRSAQRLSSEINRSFPKRIVVVTKDRKFDFVAKCELALSVQSNPTQPLMNTYRKRDAPKYLRARQQSEIGCSEASCPIPLISRFITRNQCTVSGCSKTFEEISYLGQQKLVDCMIVADMSFAAFNGERQLVVVSSDEDMFPGIIQATYYGAQVLHVHTKKRRRSPNYYTRLFRSSYIQENLEK